MAKSVVATNPHAIHSAAPLSTQYATLVSGAVVGIDANGFMKLGDQRASQGPVVARGFLIDGVQSKDPKGNVLQNSPRVSMTDQGVCKGMTASGGTALVAGKTYYLWQAGDITETRQASATGDLDQVVGFATGTDRLVIAIGAEVIHA